MTRGVIWLLLGTVMFCGCATVPPEPIPVPPLPVVQEPVEEPQRPAAPMPAEDRGPVLDSEPPWVEGPPLQVARQAAKRATMRPALAGFDRAMLVYPFRDYAAYWADVPVRGSLHIQLQPGETIRLVAGLRDSEWIVQRDDAQAPTEVSHLAITPKEHPISARGVLITTFGVYYLDLHSQETEGIYAVSWRHPVRGVR